MNATLFCLHFTTHANECNSVRSWQLERMGWGSNGAQKAAAGTATGGAVSAALGMAARAESTDLP
jgi:hypothetical protein